MYQWSFWKEALERAVKSFAQGVLTVLTLDGVFSLMNADWQSVLVGGGSMAVFSLLTSIISSPIGGQKGDPSLTT